MVEVLRWFAYISAALFWLSLVLGIIATKKVRKQILDDLGSLDWATEGDLEDNWGWVVDVDGDGLPLYVPTDIADQAIDVLSQETQADRDWHAANQWKWLITPMGIRQAMAIAQEEPNLEVAFLTWMAQQPPPPEEDKPT